MIDSELRGGLAISEERNAGDVVYAVLRETQNGLVELDHATDVRPEGGLFLKGHSTDDWRFRRAGRQALSVKYGIETYFVEQSAGLAIEKKRGGRGGVQVPLEVEVVVGGDGTAIIKGHRWSPLGIGILVLPLPRQVRQFGQPAPTPVGAKLELTLENASQEPLAILDVPDLGAFRLRPVRGVPAPYELVDPLGHDRSPEDSHVILLEPGESHVYNIDFEDDRWLVRNLGTQETPVKIATLPWKQTFRLVYSPPPKEACAHLENPATIWHGYLESQAFHGTGRID